MTAEPARTTPARALATGGFALGREKGTSPISTV